MYALHFGGPDNFYSVGVHFSGGKIYGVYYRENNNIVGVFTISEDGYDGPKGVTISRAIISLTTVSESL